MDYINILFNPDRVVNLNNLQAGGDGIARTIKSTASSTIHRWYYYFIYIFLTYIVFCNDLRNHRNLYIYPVS